MREIKFRAWHEGYTHPRRTEPKMLYDTKIGDCLKWKADSQPVLLMQFTGLKDDKFNEIYEGDIVKINDFYEGDYLQKGGNCIIQYEDDGFGLYRNKDYGNYVCALCEAVNIHGVEVIGNIFENPELIS